MGTIKDKVAIVGMGCTSFGEHWDKSVYDLIIEAAYEAFEDAGIEPNDVQAAWFSTDHSKEFLSPGGNMLSGPLKLRNIPITRVENACASGHDAIRNAAFAIASGMYDIVLVLGAEKLKDTGFGGLGTGRGLHPVFEIRRTAPGTFALLATRKFYAYGISPDEGKRFLAKIAVKNHYNGARCPKAHLRREVSLEEVLQAPIVAWPLGLFDCCGNSDGAAAAILVRGELARNFRKDPIYLKGVGLSMDSMLPVNRPRFDWLGFEANRVAAKQAYEQAGIRNPRKELDIAEVHDCFTITELTIYEDLGFSPAGGAVLEDIESGAFTLEGDLPVNADGGLKAFGHPIGASALRMTYEVYKQLQGKAELPERQLKAPRLGLSHTLGGPPQVAAVAIFGNELG
ncbi:MAG: acetyl-CoA acetyltransferase [Chloroflexi bacterium]|nr:MAG: acetyl-CoA acetyltransferase [Chloroflexota bacterium]